MKHILITGSPGAGKTTFAKTYTAADSTTHDLEAIVDMYYLLDPVTGARPDRKDYEHSVASVERFKWMIDKDKLKQLILEATSENNYYCGMSSNMFELFELFDEVYYLPAEASVIRQRLKQRGPDEFANTQEVQDWVVARISNLESNILKHGGKPLPENLTR